MNARRRERIEYPDEVWSDEQVGAAWAAIVVLEIVLQVGDPGSGGDQPLGLVVGRRFLPLRQRRRGRVVPDDERRPPRTGGKARHIGPKLLLRAGLFNR